MNEHQLLNRPLTELAFSKKFLEASAQMTLSNLGDIVSVDPAQLRAETGFSYLWLEELTRFLAENNLIGLLQPLPGNNAG